MAGRVVLRCLDDVNDNCCSARPNRLGEKVAIGCDWELGQRVRARAPDENASKDRDYRGQVRV